ncbi:hypothetical protein [Mesorhizobium sp. M0058]|uniref:hypothetical protein n=1 Tax=Mesorhizobium sp. M0058 TaxID=2956865 RepID=UPI003335134B
MSVYTICGEFVRACCTDEYYALNVLFEFVKDNDKRIAVDRAQRKILRIYVDICKEKRAKHMSVWLKQLAANQNRNVELVTVNVTAQSEREIFVEAALRAPKPRKMIIWSFDDYPSADANGGVQYLDREWAKKDVVLANEPREKAKERVETVTKYEIKSGHGTNIIIGSRLKDSVHHLNSHVSQESAELLGSVAECVEASGSQEAGDVFDKLAEEVKKEGKSESAVSGYVQKLFDYIPDMARIGKTVKETVEVLMGTS